MDKLHFRGSGHTRESLGLREYDTEPGKPKKFSRRRGAQSPARAACSRKTGRRSAAGIFDR